ncbi:MAG: TraB/VirB10 family protein [Bdellovibrionales bacterium]|nr:TraB/VirB10 family protein [Bdellovibrionales bacterium]
MKQQLEDIKLLLKNDKRIAAAAIFIAIALFVWLLTGTESPQRRRIVKEVTPSEQGMGSTEAYGDLIVAFRNDIEEGKKQRKEMNDVLYRTTVDLKEHKERVTGIFETLVDKFEQLAREVDALAAALRTQGEQIPLPSARELDGPDELEPMGFDTPTVAPPPPEPQPLRVSVIAPGDSATVSLVTGVNAPTDGTPYPVVFKLTGPITGPDGSSLDLGEARLIAAAQGSEADARALFRLTQLSIRHPNGRRAVVEVDGWIVGEDGVRGMQGRLIDKLGRLIAATAIISGLGALGERLDDRTRVVVDDGSGLAVNQDDVEFAAASAVTDASNRLGQVLLNRYESLVPVVEVLSGREVAAIFSKPAEIAILNDEIIQAAAGGPLN